MTTELYTIKQVAEALGVSNPRAYQLVHEYELGTQYGLQYLLTREEIEKLRNRQPKVPHPAKPQPRNYL